MNLVERLILRPDRPALSAPAGIIVHAMGQLVAGKPAWEHLRDLNPAADAHRLIYPDGTVQQAIPSSMRANHAGISRLGLRPGMNTAALGVELLVAGDHTLGTLTRALRDPRINPFTPAQLTALIECCKDWTASYPSIRWILGHEQVSGPWVREDPKPDPGPWIEWPMLWFNVFGRMPWESAA